MATIATTRSVGRLTLAALAVGVVLVVLSYVVLDWYHVDDATPDAAGGATFADLHVSVDRFGGLGAATAYFDWLSWTLLVLVIVAGAGAAVRTRFTDALRVVGFAAGVLGVVGTYYALLQYFDAQADAGAERHSPLYNSSWGLYCALIGYAIAALAAARGPADRDTD